MYEDIQRDHHCKIELNQLVFAPGKLVPRPVIKTRVGRPRSGWLTETCTDAYQFLHGLHAVFDMKNNNHLHYVVNTAKQQNRGYLRLHKSWLCQKALHLLLVLLLVMSLQSHVGAVALFLRSDLLPIE